MKKTHFTGYIIVLIIIIISPFVAEIVMDGGEKSIGKWCVYFLFAAVFLVQCILHYSQVIRRFAENGEIDKKSALTFVISLIITAVVIVVMRCNLNWFMPPS